LVARFVRGHHDPPQLSHRVSLARPSPTVISSSSSRAISVMAFAGRCSRDAVDTRSIRNRSRSGPGSVSMPFAVAL
jgi:hypothetical protein